MGQEVRTRRGELVTPSGLGCRDLWAVREISSVFLLGHWEPQEALE